MNRGRGARGHSMAALEAEAGTPGQFRATGVAGEREAGAAAEAEPGVSRIVLLAPGTVHAERLQLKEPGRFASSDE